MIPKNTEKPVTQNTLSSPPAANSIVGIPLATPYFLSCKFTRIGTVTAGERAPSIHLEGNKRKYLDLRKKMLCIVYIVVNVLLIYVFKADFS